jgi:hypothetical protein
MGVTSTALSLEHLDPAIGLCIAVGCRHRPYIRGVLRQGVDFVDALDEVLYHSVASALPPHAGGAAGAAASEPPLPAAGAVGAASRAGSEGVHRAPSVLAPEVVVADVPGASQHLTCPLFCPALHAAVTALLDRGGGGSAGGAGPGASAGPAGAGVDDGPSDPAADEQLVRSLVYDATRAGKWHHVRFLATLLPPGR